MEYCPGPQNGLGNHNPGQRVEQPASAKALHGAEEELGVSENEAQNLVS